MLFYFRMVEGGGEVGERSYVYVAGGPEGLFIIDATDPGNPELAMVEGIFGKG